MKKILVILFCFSVVFSVAMFSTGCGLINPAGPTSTITPTNTAVSNIAADVIVGTLTNINILGIPTVTYQVAVYTAAGVTVTTATVTVNGPNGLKTLVYNGTSGYYEYGSPDTADFQYGQKYTIKVIDGLNTYEQDVIAASDITIATDGSTVTWTDSSPGIPADIIMVTAPGPAMHTYGPSGVTSPYNLAGTGVYSAGTGAYLISPVLTTTQIPAFGGSSPLSTVIVINSKTTAYIKIN